MVHVVTCLHVRNVHSLKPACRMVQLLQHDVLVLSASCKRSINVTIEHDRHCCSQVRKQEMHYTVRWCTGCLMQLKRAEENINFIHGTYTLKLYLTGDLEFLSKMYMDSLYMYVNT